MVQLGSREVVMKRILILMCLLLSSASIVFAGETYSVKDLKKMNIDANSSISKEELLKAQKIMLGVYEKTSDGVKQGKGPFYAEIYDKNGKLIAASSNSVVEDNCSIYHAEVNTLKKAHSYYKQYNLAPKDLTIYANAEPCIMCAGAIMWSGVKTVYFGVPSKSVEKITGFDEGFKPNWINEFKKRGITVYGNIEQQAGERILQDYVNSGKEIYKPTRK